MYNKILTQKHMRDRPKNLTTINGFYLKFISTANYSLTDERIMVTRNSKGQVYTIK